MTEKRRPVLVIGYGNPLRSDDGFGWRVASRLDESGWGPQAEVMACHQLTPELAQDISTRELVVFVDVETGRPAGEISVRRVESEPAGATTFGHTLEPAGLLALARELFGGEPEALLISTGSESFEFGERLSPSVETAVGAAAQEVRRIVADWGPSSSPRGKSAGHGVPGRK